VGVFFVPLTARYTTWLHIGYAGCAMQGQDIRLEMQAVRCCPRFCSGAGSLKRASGAGHANAKIWITSQSLSVRLVHYGNTEPHPLIECWQHDTSQQKILYNTQPSLQQGGHVGFQRILSLGPSNYNCGASTQGLVAHTGW
jgi:hypothetical protein